MTYTELKRPPIRVPQKILEEDRQFFLEKRNRDLIANDLCLSLLPIIRQYNFLPKRVLRECFNQSLNHIIHTPQEEN